MSKFLVVLLTVISLATIAVSDAEAKRMGSSRSFGKQSPNVTRQQAPAQPGANQVKPAAPAAAPAGAAAPKPASPWKGMLGGALLGLGLGALLSSMGIGAGMANIISMLLMAGIGIALVMFVMRLLRQNKQKSELRPVMNNTYSGPADYSATSTATPEIGSRINEYSGRHSGSEVLSDVETAAAWEIPSDFDVKQFERTAQTYFIRLQAAWDKADINDIREFTTPEMYAEIKIDMQERGAVNSVTEVITINSKLLGIETQETYHLASVKFVGTIKEELNGPTESFEEVWNLSKPVSGQGGWLLAGIQQVN